jgi:hypothetical protein
MHNDPHKLYSSPSIMRLMKSRSMRFAEHLARMLENMNAYRLLVGSQKERDNQEDQDVGR